MRSALVIRWRLFLSSLLLTVWLMACSEKELLSDAELQGQSLYNDNCSECHENSQPDLRKQPPNLHGVFSAKVLPSGALATDEQVRKTIIEGRGTMPAFDQRLREQDVDDLLKYLHTLR